MIPVAGGWSGILLRMFAQMQKSIGTLLCLAIISIATPIQAETYVPSVSCKELFDQVRASKVQRAADTVVMSDVACGAYKFLIDRYDPGPCSQKGFSNPKVEGITSLNPDFAVRLATLLVEGEAAVGKFGINSAFRTGGPNGGQACANPRGYGGNTNASPHAQGLAVDLVYPGGGTKNDCSSAGYKWIVANAGRHGIAQYNQVHSFVKGECNHIENTGKVTGGPGPGAATVDTSPPSAGFAQAIRQALGISTQQPAYTSQGAYPSQPISQTQSPISSYQPQQGIAVTTGTGATSGAGASSNSGAYAGENVDIVGVSSQIGATSGGGTTHATTAADRLEELAFGTGTNASAGTNATSVPLVVTASNATGITSSQNPSTGGQQAVSQISPTQQTFISGDLSWQTGNTLQSTGLSGWDAILVTIKATLNRILQLLQPFGTRASFEESEEWGE